MNVLVIKMDPRFVAENDQLFLRLSPETKTHYIVCMIGAYFLVENITLNSSLNLPLHFNVYYNYYIIINYKINTTEILLNDSFFSFI